MIGELIPTGVTFGVGRNSINTSFSGTAEFNNVALDSGADFSGGTGGGILYSGGTDLYSIFVTSSVDTTTAGNGLTKTGDNITLGGTLTGNTNIDLNSSTFSLSDTDFSIYTFATSNQKRLAISGDTNALNEFYSVSNMPLLGGFGGVAMGTIGPNAVIPGVVPERGVSGDTYIYSSARANGLNIISADNPSGTEDYIRLYAGQDALGTPDIHVQGNGATRGYVGLNNDNPQELLHLKDGDFLIETSNGLFYSDLDNVAGALVALSGLSTDLTRFGVSTPNSESITMGIRGSAEVGFASYGKQGDSFIRSSNQNNGLNLISSLGTGTDDYIRFFAGQDATGTPDIHIQGSGATKGYVGVKTANPQYQLDINGDINASGIIYSGGTDLYNIFLTSATDATTASNGLTKSGDNITLGGTLTGNTIIATDANEFQINAGGGAGNVLFSGDGASTEQIRFLTEFIPLEPAEITIGKGAVKMLSTSGLTSAFIAAGGAQAQITFDDGVGQRKIVAGAGNYDIYDSIGNRGINYISNYHANYENRTLVDFEYVNNHVASATTGGGGSITGTGTTSTISKWDSISGLTDSQLTDDGVNVSVYTEKIRRKTTHNFGTSGGTVNWDIDNSSNSKITLSSSLTLNISNVEDGDFGTLKITQDGVGSHTITLGTGTHRVANGGAGAITLTATANATDIISFFYDGAEFFWSAGNDYT